MSVILKKQKIDLLLTPVDLIPLSDREYLRIPPLAIPFAETFSHQPSHKAYLQSLCPSPSLSSSSSSPLLQNFIISTAGHTLFRYNLGIGDYHTDSVLIFPSGKVIVSERIQDL